MSFPAKMRAFAHKVSRFCGSDWDFGVLPFLYFGFDLKLGDLKTMRDIVTTQDEHNRFTFLESDGIRTKRKSMRYDFNPPW